MGNKPRILRSGDKIGIVAPGGQFNRERFDGGVKFLKSLGLVPIYGPHLFKKDFIFAGTIKQRAESLKDICFRDDIRAVWCVRGGYGSYAVADFVSQWKAPKVPKFLIGMSDVTALHLAVSQNWNWPVLHGPLLDRLGSDLCGIKEKKSIVQTLFDEDYRFTVDKGLKVLKKGPEVRAQMTGGNLALVTASLGTPWEIDTDHKILFLEDIGERAYRVDRMMYLLNSRGKFKKVKALVLGDFTECAEPDGKVLWPEVFKRYFKNLNVPILAGIRSGHGDLRLTVPLGVEALVNTSSSGKIFEITEKITASRNDPP